MAEIIYRKIGRPDYMYRLHKLANQGVISEAKLEEIAQSEMKFLFSLGFILQKQYNIRQSFLLEGDDISARMWDSVPDGLLEAMEKAYGSRLQNGDLREVGKKYIKRELRIQQREEELPNYSPPHTGEAEKGRHAVLKLRDWVMREFYPNSKGGVEHIVNYWMERSA